MSSLQSYLSVVDFVCYAIGGDFGYSFFLKHFLQIIHSINRRSSNPKQAKATYIQTFAVNIVKNAEEVDTVVLLGALEYSKHAELLSHNKQLLMTSAQLRQDDPDK